MDIPRSWLERVIGVSLAKGKRNRALLVVYFSLVLTLVGQIFAVIYYLNGATEIAAVLVLSAPLGIAVPLSMRLMQSPAAAGQIMAGALLTILVAISFQTGGLSSTTIIWLAIVPLVALSTTGVRSGFVWLGLSLCAIVLVGWHHPFVEVSLLRKMPGTVWTASLSLLVLCIFLLVAIHQSFEKEALQRLTRADAAKSDFLATMSHEVRTPLNGIIGMTDLLLEQSFEEEKVTLLRALRESSEDLLYLLNDVLDFAKIEAEKIELEQLNFKLEDCFSRVTGLMGPKAKQKGLEWNVEIAEGLPGLVSGDPSRIRQILLNLLSNAIKFTDSGSVTFLVGVTELDPSRLEVSVSVKDTGPGLSLEQQEKIFDAFCQGDSSTSRRFGGSGLGLTISRSLAEAMGGKIEVESELGKGSIFHFRCPLRKVAPGGHSEEIDSGGHFHPEVAGGLKILVVDDNAVNRMITSKFLKRFGLRCDLASSGPEALRLFEENEGYHLILMDCHMPAMDGFTVTRKIREIEESARKTRIIALTANSYPEDRERCFQAGMDDFISKPVEKKAFFNVLSRQIMELEQE